MIAGVLDNGPVKAAIREGSSSASGVTSPYSVHLQAGETLAGIGDIWNDMSSEEKHELVRLVLARTEIDVRTGAVQAVIPKPAFAHLLRILAGEEGGPVSVCCWRPRGATGSAITNGSAMGRTPPGAHVTAAQFD